MDWKGSEMRYGTLNVAVIVGSTREGRRGAILGEWVVEQAEQCSGVDFDVIDLDAIDLPSRIPEHYSPEIERYLDRLDQADAFVIITPEYNHGYPASLKQAIDLGHDQWFAKPVGFVSYGGLAGGSRAVEQLRQVFPELHAVTVRNAVMLPQFYDHINGDNRFVPPEICVHAFSDMMDQLVWWGRSLREARRIPMQETG